ncbi:MAG: site-specific integrase [Armatimonadetes bacterium]|nr:site-specific integrase [Armatimonadota bacterium]
MIDRYLASQSSYSRTTLAITRQWLEHLQDFLGDRELHQVRAAELTEWHRGLLWRPGPSGKNYSQSTVNTAVGSVRRFFRWALAEKWVDEDPTRDLKTPGVPRKERGKLSPSESRKMLEAIDATTQLGTRNRALIGLLMETSIAPPTCSGIDLRHLQMDTGVLLTNGRGRRRLHSLSSGLLLDLEDYLHFARPTLARQDEPALFVSSKGHRLRAPGIREVLASCALAAGVRIP